MSDQRWHRRASRITIESRTIAGHTVWVKRDAVGIAVVSGRREDVEPETPAASAGPAR